MAPSIVYTRASSTLTSASNPSVLRSLTSSNINRSRSITVRNLWWWSRHGTWSSASDENIEERIQRHHKIMRHRYSRALRRRAMWDRDDSVPSWLCRSADGRMTRKWEACRTMSSIDPKKARLDDKPDSLSEQQKFWAKTQKDFQHFDRDFEAFKAAIDRALEKDPYGALFGRRLQSPPSLNNSSWISWLFNLGEAKQEPVVDSLKTSGKRKIEIEDLDKSATSVKSQPSHTTKTEGVHVASNAQVPPVPETEYTYDPISGRKVPRKQQTETIPGTKKTFLEVLFSEHGSAPDKSIKQHRVYGYSSESLKKTPMPQDHKSDAKPGGQKGFENSRLREYQQLRAATIGNHIDTTAEYGGKYEAEPVSEQSEPEKKERTMSGFDDNAPLFSGTTYESKADQVTQISSERSVSWLEKEGFQKSENASAATNTGTKFESTKLEPSIDRMQAVPVASQPRFISKLQPAIDRVQLVKPTESSRAVANLSNQKTDVQEMPKSHVAITRPKTVDADTREDVDLLRASDVRAATKTVRTTKQEIAQNKIEKRTQLENEFGKSNEQVSTEVVLDANQLRSRAVKLAERIDNLSKYAERYGGRTADAMKSTGIDDKKFNVYQRPHSLSKTILTEPLDFKADWTKFVPSIYDRYSQKSASKEVEVPQHVLDEIKAKEALTESLRLSNKKTEELRKRDDAQITELANNIRMAYEAEHGPIDLSLAQSSISRQSDSQETESTQPERDTNAQVSSDFFAEQANFMSKVNRIKDSVGVVKAQTAQLETDIKTNALTPDQSAKQVEGLTIEAQSLAKDVNSMNKEVDKILFQGPARPKSHPLSTASVKPGVTRYPAIEQHTQVFEPKYVKLLSEAKSVKMSLREIDASLHDMKRSRVRSPVPKDTDRSTKQREPSQMKEMGIPSSLANLANLSSPYLILTYNKSSGEVDQTAMDRLPWSKSEKVDKANAMLIMGHLNYPAAFVKHFVELERSGYELLSGGGDVLIFQKSSVQAATHPDTELPQAITPASTNLRNTIAVEEASSQPEISETIAQPKSASPKQTATVLDDIPIEIPPPGPAAPTAPPTNPLKKTPRQGPKVRRQEPVFSGTIPIRQTPTSSKQQQDQNNTDTSSNSSKANNQGPGFFARTTRTIKRGVLGVAVFGAAAYTIGVVAEGVGAQAQVEGDATAGPRRKVVMPIGQRPGIYSTESSRN